MKRFLSYSLMIFGCASCAGKLPPITSCLSDVERQVFHCISKDGQEFDCKFSDKCADKIVGIPFQDFGVVLDYCAALKK